MSKSALTRADKKAIREAIARANRTDRREKSAQDSIPFLQMWPDGICRTTEKHYTKKDITFMKVDDLRSLAAKKGIEGAEEMTGTALKPLLIERLGL